MNVLFLFPSQNFTSIVQQPRCDLPSNLKDCKDIMNVQGEVKVGNISLVLDLSSICQITFLSDTVFAESFSALQLELIATCVQSFCLSLFIPILFYR